MRFRGEVAEWSIAAVLKTVVPQGTGGSNPSLSANREASGKAAMEDDPIVSGGAAAECAAPIAPENGFDEAFTVRSYETGLMDHATLPTLCNYMQEAAGLSAESLGWGIRRLMDEGLTWMLSRLHVKIAWRVPAGGRLVMRTWPSGTKGRLVATRCFLGLADGGEEALRAHSEWLYVDMHAQKIARLPETFADLVPEGTPDFDLGDLGGKLAKLPGVTSSAEIGVRRSDLDLNGHVNNVHYVEWMLEAAPEAGREPIEMDIVFRAAAKAGDSLVSECFQDGDRILHLIRRPADGLVLASAAMRW